MHSSHAAAQTFGDLQSAAPSGSQSPGQAQDARQPLSRSAAQTSDDLQGAAPSGSQSPGAGPGCTAAMQPLRPSVISRAQLERLTEPRNGPRTHSSHAAAQTSGDPQSAALSGSQSPGAGPGNTAAAQPLRPSVILAAQLRAAHGGPHGNKVKDRAKSGPAFHVSLVVRWVFCLAVSVCQHRAAYCGKVRATEYSAEVAWLSCSADTSISRWITDSAAKYIGNRTVKDLRMQSDSEDIALYASSSRCSHTNAHAWRAWSKVPATFSNSVA